MLGLGDDYQKARTWPFFVFADQYSQQGFEYLTLYTCRELGKRLR